MTWEARCVGVGDIQQVQTGSGEGVSQLVREDIPVRFGSPEPCESSYPEANELIIIQRLLIVPSI